MARKKLFETLQFAPERKRSAKELPFTATFDPRTGARISEAGKRSPVGATAIAKVPKSSYQDVETTKQTRTREGQGKMLDTVSANTRRETTRPRVAKIRQGKRGLTVHIDPDKAEDLKAIAAADRNKGIEEYLERLILKDIAANSHLIEVGREKLKETKRYRSRAAAEQEEKNQRLVKQLLVAGLKPQ